MYGFSAGAGHMLGLAACGVGSSEGEREDYYTPV